jgi:hypothetical protein
MDRIRTRFEQGALNRFDVTGWLRNRSEASYAESLIRAYQTPSPAGRGA